MTLEKKDVIQTVEKTINRYMEWRDDPTSSSAWEIHTLLVETIWQCAPENSTFRRNAKYIIDRPLNQYTPDAFRGFCDDDKLYEDVTALFSVLSALKKAYDDNLLINVQQRIHADIFEDFIEIAENFLQESEKLKCPAAVMLGSILEAHIRKLCQNHGINTNYKKGDLEKFRKASEMNIDLVKKGVYTSVIQKQIDYWLGIRNEAAHGHEDKYTKQQVEDMIIGVRRFIGEYPA
ncbi:hypothetical protein [Methanoregula sp. UBA64]|jgi:hypothetical protein|uniref:hypothetical protein n=1 Tax=Methanoregula sp. UBA64 TaxID=1915554 RepID=UPI0025CC024E|nr:hypothetical protein [Methanoregula sp. UBA64]